MTVRQTEVASNRVAHCVKVFTETRALFVCQGHDHRVFIAEEGFKPLPWAGDNFTSALLACQRELGIKGIDPTAPASPITIARR